MACALVLLALVTATLVGKCEAQVRIFFDSITLLVES
jgi:hypothetical protein